MSNVITRFITDTFFGGRMLRAEKQGDNSFWYNIQNKTIDLPFNTAFEIYRNITPLRAIINKRISFWANLRLEVIKTDSEEDEVDYDHEFNRLLDKANAFQSWRQMLAMIGLYKMVAGVSFVLPGFGLSKRASNLVYLKPVEFETFDKTDNMANHPLMTDSIDDLIYYYTFYLKNGKAVKYKPSELIDFKDSAFSYTENITRITTGMMPITNIYKDMVNRGILMDAKGGTGMISGNQRDGGVAVPMSKKERKRINLNLDKYGLGHGKTNIILTDVPLQYTPMVFPTSQLMLFEEMEDDFNQLCDLYEMARELFVGDASYAATRGQAEKETYTNTIIPEWEDFVNTLNRELGLQKDKRALRISTAHIGCLQEDEGKNIANQAAKSAMLMAELEKGIITTEEYKQQMGYVTKS